MDSAGVSEVVDSRSGVGFMGMRVRCPEDPPVASGDGPSGAVQW